MAERDLRCDWRRLILKRNIGESMRMWLGRLLLQCANNELLAIAICVGIRNEVLLRRAVGRPIERGMKLVGRETPSPNCRQRVTASIATYSTTSDHRGSTRRPVVNWHEGGHGPGLLLVNGYTASGLVWPEIWVRQLEDRYHVIRIDNRGTGGSRSAPRPYTIDELADDARDVLRACDIERATVLGFSMGGMIAQELAIRHHEMVDKLVLVATRPPAPAQIPPHGDAYALLLRRPPPGADMREFLTAVWGQTAAENFAADHPDVIDEIVTQLMCQITTRGNVSHQARAIAAWHGAARLGRLAVPTTIVHGNRDRLIPIGNGIRLAQLIPGANYVELPGVGHLVPHEAGDDLLRAVDGT